MRAFEYFGDFRSIERFVIRKNRQNWKRIEKGVTFLGIAVTPAIFVFHRSKTKLNPMKSTQLSVIYVACRALKINDRPI